MATQPTPLSVGAWNTIDVLVRQGFNFLTVIALARLRRLNSGALIFRVFGLRPLQRQAR
jgi:hypothetical protein